MSKSIDERIVQMKFDNKQFEDGIQTSTKSLENLKKGLNLNESAKSLSNLEKVGKSFSLAGIANGVDTLVNRFTTLGIVGITAIQNITNSAINAGRRMISSLTIDPIKMGYGEYETKMGAIQTILTNTADKGTTLEDVNATLNELNQYADKTIYNFSEMTRNIGTFTAAGVDLETSATSIKGIANLAAGSGSSAQQASTAMYQLSQAIASGTVKLQDWNSVVNAGMGGQLFQKALEKTAVELGHGRDMSVSFRESLEKGWITTEVLTKTLAKLAADESLLKAATQVRTLTQLLDTMKESVQSGWAQTWETIVGDNKESAAFFTAISDGFSKVSGASADARNAMWDFWAANGGRVAVIEGISNALLGLSSILEPIEEAFREIFPAMTGERLVEISKGFRDLMAHFKIGAETAANLKLTFKGLFAVLDIGLKVFNFLASAVGMFIKALVPGSGSLLEITGRIGQFLVSLDDMIEKNNLVGKSLEKLGVAFGIITNVISMGLTALEPLMARVKEGVSKAGEAFASLFAGTTVFAAGLDDTVETFSTARTETNKLGDAFNKLHVVMTNIKNAVVTVATTIKSFLSPILDSLKKKFDSFSMQDFGALMTGGGLLIIAKALSKALSSVDSVVSNFSKVIEQVGDTLKAFQLKVKAQALLAVAIALGVLTAAIVALSFVKMEDLVKSLGALTIVFGELVGALIILNKATKTIKMGKIAGQLIGIGVALLLLANAVRILSAIPWKNLMVGTGALAGIMGILILFINITRGGDLAASAGGLIAFSIGLTILTGALAILGKMDVSALQQGGKALSALMAVIALFVNFTRGGDLAASAGGLVAFSIGITILTGALAILANIDYAKLQQGGKALAAMMMVIALFVNFTRGGDLAASAGGLIGFSIGITILTGALTILGKMDYNALMQGGKALAILMIGLMGFINRTKSGDLAASAGGLIAFSVGLIIMTKALGILGSMDANNLSQATKAMSSILLVLGLFIKFTKGGDLGVSSLALIGFSIGLIALSGAVAILAAIDPNRLTQGIKALGALMLSIAGFITLTKSGDLEKSSKGLIGFSVGLMILAGVIAILSALNTDKLMAASVALSVLITVIGAFVKLTQGGDLMKIAIGLGVLSGALFLFTQVITALGTMDLKTLLIGMAAFAGVLVTLGLTAKLISSLTPYIVGLAVAIGALGLAFVTIGVAVLAFSAGMDLLAKSGTAGAAALTTVFTSMVALIPLMLKTLAQGLVEFIKVIGDSSPVVAEAFIKVLDTIINTIDIVTPKIINCIVKLISAILDALTIAIPVMVNAGMKLIVGILRGIADNIQDVIEAGIDVVLNFIMGVTSKLPAIIDSAFNLIITFINGLANTIRNSHDAIYTACGNLIDAMIDSFMDLIPSLVGVGKNIVNGLIQGVESMISNAAKTASNLGNKIIDSAKAALGIHSPSRMFAEIGNNIVKGLSGGIDDNAKNAIQSSTNMSNDVTKASSGVVKASNKASKEAFDKAVEWIDERKYYNQLSLQEELKAWQDLQAKYIEGTEERKKADREVYRVKQALIKQEEDDRKKAFDKSVQEIDDRKYYNQLSLTEELAAWQAIQAKYLEGTEERKKADREVYRVKNELINKQKQIEEDFRTKSKQIEDDYYAKTKEVNDNLKRDIQSLNEEYERALESRTNSLYASYSLFDKVEPPETVSGQELIDNLKSQVVEFQEWQDNINALSAKGINEGLISELEAMGPKASAQIKALNDLSSEDLDNYVFLWKVKHAEAKDQALSELDGMKTETAIKIEALNTEAKTKLEEYKKTWISQITELAGTSIKEMETLRTTIQSTVTGLRTGTEQEVTTLTDNIQTIIKTPDWVSIGGNIIEGMKQGVRGKAESLAAEVAKACLDALNAAKVALGIQSPSKEFAKVGMYSAEGLALGLRNFSGTVALAASGVGETAINALKDTITNISDIINGNVDMTPVIRPVLDLSNIQNGAKTIGTLMSANQKVAITAQRMNNNQSQGVADDIRSVVRDELSKLGRPGTEINQHLEIHSPTALSPSETARQNRRVMQELALQF